MTTRQVVAQVQLEHARQTVWRLTLPGHRPGARPGLVVLGCLGAAVALVLGYALARGL